MPKRIFTVTAAILKMPIIGKWIEKTVENAIRAKVEATENPYDDLAVDILFNVLRGNLFIGDQLIEFIMIMADKYPEQKQWQFMKAAFIRQAKIENGE